MNEKINKKIMIILALAIIFSVLGATFAYFSATVTGNNNVTATSYKFDVTLAVNRVNPASEPSKGYGMIPLDESNIATAINAGCIDSNGYAACTIYQLTFTNNSGVAITLDGEMNVTSNNFASLKYSVTAVGGAKSTLSTGTALGSSAVTTGFTNLTIPTGTSTMYLMLYIENQSSNQTTDQGKTFSGTLTFTDASGGSELYAQFGNTPTEDECENCVYTIDDSSKKIRVNQILPNNATTYPTLDALETAVGSRDYWLKLKVENNTVTDAWVEIRRNNTIYSLKGGDGGTAFLTNAKTIYDAFEGTECSVDDNMPATYDPNYTPTPSFDFYCSVSGLSASANSDGNVFVCDDEGAYCEVSYVGPSYCGG